MKQSQIILHCLEAENGCFITQAADVPDTQRILATRVSLSPYDSADNYKEISAIEAGRIRAAKKLLQDEAVPGLPE